MLNHRFALSADHPAHESTLAELFLDHRLGDMNL